VKTEEGTIIYKTVELKGTTKCFDVTGPEGEKLCRILPESSESSDDIHKKWEIFRFGEPSYEGQEPHAAASTDGEKLYKKAYISLGEFFGLFNNCAYYKGKDDVLETVLKIEVIKGPDGPDAKYQTVLPHCGTDGPLVGYWSWEHKDDEHKVLLRLSKGSDIALHVVLVVVANIFRVETLAKKS